MAKANYEQERVYLIARLSEEFPFIKSASQDPDGLLATLTRTELIGLDLELSRFKRLESEDESSQNPYANVDSAPLKTSTLVDDEVRRISAEVTHKNSSQTYGRDSERRVGRGGQTWNGTGYHR